MGKNKEDCIFLKVESFRREDSSVTRLTNDFGVLDPFYKYMVEATVWFQPS